MSNLSVILSAGAGAGIGAAVCASAGSSVSVYCGGAGYFEPPLYTIHVHIRDHSFAFKEEREKRERAGR